jgi:Ca2+-binding EF-hand superfamily protein
MDTEWENLIDEFDENRDGMINFDEFKRMMLHINKRNPT